jgi:GT2 family glycosyltransferase
MFSKLTVVFSSHKDSEYNQNFINHLKSSSGLSNDNLDILCYENFNQYSLSEIYNRGLEDSKTDLVVFCHNDIKLSKNWGLNLIQDFNSNSEYGIIGKAGSTYMGESGVFWERMQQTMVGEVYHAPENTKRYLSKYSVSPNSVLNTKNKLINACTVDGLFFAVNKNVIKHKFDDSFKGFHFYDHSFTIPNYLDGVKIGVTFSFDITHESVGQPNEEFEVNRQQFVEKYKHILPITEKVNVLYNKEENIKLKKTGKVSIVIPTKDKIDLITQCVDSIIKNTTYPKDKFDILIADTGSNKECLEQTKQLIDLYPNNNIEVIEYNYYNFAKINNDVVRNYCNDSEFILFSNNDIIMLNDCLTRFVNKFNNKHNLGTIGARLHFSDGSVQHGGQILVLNSQGNLGVTHDNLQSHYNYSNKEKLVCGNTAAFVMTRLNVFKKIGMFNENYISCFEDVELGLQTILHGFENICDMNSVCYHLESQTRNDDDKKLEMLQQDWVERLFPFIYNNQTKLNKYILRVQ